MSYGSIDVINSQITEIIKAYSDKEGILATPVPNVFFVRKTPAGQIDRCFEKPLFSLILQGEKRTVFGSREFDLSKNMTIVSGIDLPSASFFKEKDGGEQFISMFLYFDTDLLLETVMETDKNNMLPPYSDEAFAVGGADAEVMECMLRLARLAEKPEQINLRAPLILRELYFLLLIGSSGRVLHGLFAKGTEKNRIMQAIALIKDRLDKPLAVNELAKNVNMSVSSLYRYFKTMTGVSPLQYQKQLRLHEAQRLMLVNREKAASAAYSVGYESVTQFNREYKRMFGNSPFKDIKEKTVRLA